MKGKQLLQAMLLVAALVALVLAWPAIARSARKPRIGEWVPGEDPGTVLTVVMNETPTRSHRSYVLSLGSENFGLDISCPPPAGYTELRSRLYRESDGVLGETGEPYSSSITNTSPTPSATEQISGFGGFQTAGHLLAEVTFSDDLKVKAMVAPPMEIRRGAETDWAPLAVVWDLGVLIEWSQTKDHLLVRRSALTGHAAPVWNGGGFTVGGKGCQFTDDMQVARLFRARVPELRDGYQNVQLTIYVMDDGIRTDVTVR